ncbi:prosaposin-like [Misgurnus anguillicaudatus]|uniref:prosaposin-like n=1 Tax=Misgurnus anguillicaudatus TaxID=75329 RepID=UPI003CCF4715
MLRNIFLVTLIVYSVSAVHLKIYEVDSNEDLHQEEPAEGLTTTQQVFGACTACKWVMDKIKKTISKNSTPDQIKGKLYGYCEKTGFLKKTCNFFINEYLNTLIEEFSTNDGPKAICTKFRACKSKQSIMEFIQAYNQEFDNL